MSMKRVLVCILLLGILSCDDKLDWLAEEPPEIHQLTPASGVEGTEVIISGEKFSKTATKNTVVFNGVAAVITQAKSSTLTVIVPASSTGPVVVTVSGRGPSNPVTFTYDE